MTNRTRGQLAVAALMIMLAAFIAAALASQDRVAAGCAVLLVLLAVCVNRLAGSDAAAEDGDDSGGAM
jgi:phosphotransferase system  glucose/maltose/N-acetylglucosamine-specific IIC component